MGGIRYPDSEKRLNGFSGRLTVVCTLRGRRSHLTHRAAVPFLRDASSGAAAAGADHQRRRRADHRNRRAYTAGLKDRFVDNRLELNLDLFY